MRAFYNGPTDLHLSMTLGEKTTTVDVGRCNTVELDEDQVKLFELIKTHKLVKGCRDKNGEYRYIIVDVARAAIPPLTQEERQDAARLDLEKFYQEVSKERESMLAENAARKPPEEGT